MSDFPTNRVSRLIGLAPTHNLDTFGRRWGIIGGLLLLVGLLMPMFGVSWTGQVEMQMGWEAAFSSSDPDPKIIYVLAVVTGLASLFAGIWSEGRFRAYAMSGLGLGVIGYALASNPEMLERFVAGETAVYAATTVLGFLVMLIGARLTILFPDRLSVRLTGGIGAGAVLAGIAGAVVVPMLRLGINIDLGDWRNLFPVLLFVLLVGAALCALAMGFVRRDTVRRRLGSTAIILATALIGGMIMTNIVMAAQSSTQTGAVMMGIVKIWALVLGLFLIPSCGIVDLVAQRIAAFEPALDVFAFATERKAPPPSVLCSNCGETVLLAHGRCNHCGTKIGDETRRMVIAAENEDANETSDTP